MHRPLAKFKLRNVHEVYEINSGFEVTVIDRRGVEHKYKVPQEAADLLCNLCIGECVTAEEASRRIAPHAKRLALEYHYGHKLGYYTQEILLALSATGRATIRKVGRGFEYQVIG